MSNISSSRAILAAWLISSMSLAGCSAIDTHRAQQHLDKAKLEYRLDNPEASLLEVTKSIEFNSVSNDGAYYQRAVLLLDQGNAAGAIQDLKAAKDSYNDDPLFHFRMGRALGILKQYRQAIKSLSESIRLDANEIPSAYYNRGISYKILNQHEYASRDFTEYIRRAPEDPDGWIERAIISFKSRNYDESLSDLEVAISKDRNAKRAYLYKGLILNQRRDHRNAVKALESFSRFDERSDIFSLMATALSELGEPAKALEYYDKSLQLNKNNAEAFFGRSGLYMTRGNHRAADSDISKAISLSPKNGSYYLRKGNILLSVGKDDEADTYLKKGAELNGTLSEYYYLKGRAASKRGELREAMKSYELSLSEDPRSVKTLNSLGVTYYQLHDDYQKAIELYSQALSIAPGDWLIYLNRCQARLSAKDFKGAISDCNRVEALNPTVSTIYSKRGRAYIGLNKLEAAEGEFTSAISVSPTEQEYTLRAITRHRRGKIKEAISDLNKSIELNPEERNNYALRGIYYEEYGDFDSACKDWSKASKLGHQEAKEWFTNQCEDAEVMEVAVIRETSA